MDRSKSLIALLLELPLMHVLMKYLMEAPCNYWHTLKQNYGKGLHHWGLLFNVMFLSSLLVMLASLVIGMPAYILDFANQKAHPSTVARYVFPIPESFCEISHPSVWQSGFYYSAGG